MHGIVTPEDIKRTKLGIPLSKKEEADHKNYLADLERKERKRIAEKARAAGLKPKQIRADDGSVGEVWVFASSYHAMGFEDHQIAAAGRFESDWNSAYRALRGQGYEPGVDGARNIHGHHLSQVQAQARLQEICEYLGRRSWDIVVAVVVHGATARQIHAMGGKDHVSVKSDMTVAFNDLDAFYTGSQHKDRTWSAIEQFNAERAAMIEAAEKVL